MEEKVLYNLLKEALDNNGVHSTSDTDHSKADQISWAYNMGYLQKHYHGNGKFFGAYKITEKAQKVIEAEGDFSVLKDKPSIQVNAQNASVGDNHGVINQNIFEKKFKQQKLYKQIALGVLTSLIASFIFLLINNLISFNF